MAIGRLQALSLLRKTLFLSFFAAQIVAFVGLHVLFQQIEKERAESIAALVGTMLRDESHLSRAYLIAQSLEDMQSNGVLVCAKIGRVDAHAMTWFYDSVFRPDCQASKLRASRMKGLDGQNWELRLQPARSLFLMLAQGLAFLATFIGIGGIFLFFQKKVSEERREREMQETKVQVYKDLTSQAVHDVSSPITALRLIADQAPLDPPTRDFLRSVLSRTEGIFKTLQSAEEPGLGPVNLAEVIQKVIQEKNQVWKGRPAIAYAPLERMVEGSEVEISRMISNLLNNSKEAGADRVVLTHQDVGLFTEVLIGDNAPPIPAIVKQRIGSRKNSVGKENGQGLGLFHAHNFMHRVGGRLVLGERSSEKISLRFPV